MTASLEKKVRGQRWHELERRFDGPIPADMRWWADYGPVSVAEMVECGEKSLAWFEEGIAQLIEKGKTDAAAFYGRMAEELRRELNALQMEAAE